MERKLIFDAALKLIKDGKFLGSPMSEVAYYANLTEKTVSYFFESRNQLISELALHIVETIRSTVQDPSETSLPFQERFFHAWFALYNFYRRSPAMLAFVEQSPNLTHFGEKKFDERTFISPLVRFFESAPAAIRERFDAETMALVFHGSIITAVKLKQNNPSRNRDAEIQSLPEILWNGITQAQPVA